MTSNMQEIYLIFESENILCEIEHDSRKYIFYLKAARKSRITGMKCYPLHAIRSYFRCKNPENLPISGVKTQRIRFITEQDVWLYTNQ